MRRSRGLPCSAVLFLLGCLPLASTEIPIDGRVRDSGGVALAGIRVELRPILSSYEQGLRDLDGRAVEAAARTVTDQDGRFALLAPGEGMWEVGVFAEGFVPQRFRLAPLLAAETLIPVKLRRDAGLRVRVEGPDGRPLAGARVVVRASATETPGWQTVPRIATSGADGMARLACSRDESLILLAAAPGFPVQEGPEIRGPAEVSFRLAAGASHRIEAPEDAIVRDLQTALALGRGGAEVMTRGGSWLLLETAGGARVRFAVPDKIGPVRVEVPAPAPLLGNVIDSETRQPLAGAWIWPRDDPGRFVRSDGQGAYRLEVAGLARAVGLEIAAAGRLSEIVDHEIPWPAGGLPPVALDAGAVLAGTVVDEEGRPAAGAEVAALAAADFSWVQRPGFPRAPRVGRVSARGEVRITGVWPGSEYRLVAGGPGFSPVWLRRVELAARENRFRLVLSRSGAVSGRIVDGEGKPVPGAEVRIEPGVGAASLRIDDDPGLEADRGAETGPDGRFTLADVPPGWYEMVVRRPGAVAERLPRFAVRRGGGNTDLGALRLANAETLAGRVIDPEGRPVAGAEVWASLRSELDGMIYNEELWPVAVSGPDGSFALRASRWQALDLTVCGPASVPLAHYLPRFFPDEPLILTVQPAASVSGRAMGSNGFPVAGYWVSADLIGEPGIRPTHECGDGWYISDEAGRFRRSNLEPGVYTVAYEDHLALGPGEARETVVHPHERGEGAALFGRLLGPGGAPVPGAEISLGAREHHGHYYTQHSELSRTDADGNYRLTFSRPGLEVDPESYGVSRHGRTLVERRAARWEGPAAVAAESRFDITLEEVPEPPAPVADVELEDQRQEPGPATTIAGRILGLAPEELAQVRVLACLSGWRSSWTAAAVDPEGTYRLEGLARDGWWIRAEAADRTLFEAVPIPEGEARIERDLVFEPVSSVDGSIGTPGREPVAGAVVRLRHFAGELQMRRPDAEVPTRGDGTFSIRLPDGWYEITAEKQGFLAPEEEDSVDLRGRGGRAYLELRPAVTLRGRLTGLPSGNLNARIGATLVDGKPGYKKPVEGKMNAEGRYLIPGLGPGTWDVEVSYEVPVADKVRATGRVVIPDEAKEAVLDLAFSGQ